MERQRAVVAGLGAVVLFVLVQLGALALVSPFETAGYQAVEDPDNPANSVLYVGVLLVATAFLLLAIRLDATRFLRAFLVGVGALISLYVFSVVLAPLGEGLDLPPSALPIAAAGLFAAALYVHPEWYVIDATGVVMGAGAAGLFGISFGVLPAIVLLVLLAVYDAISVYRTKHMLTLASGVLDLRVPVVLVIPLTRSYSFIEDTVPESFGGDRERANPSDEPERADGMDGVDGTAGVDGTDGTDGTNGAGKPTETDGPAEAGDRDAVFIGLGDAVMPTVLVASVAAFVDAPALGVGGPVLTLPVLSTMLGTLVGLLVLMSLVMRGRAHAGLPLLNGGAILGYLLGALAAGIPLVQALGVGGFL